MTYTFHIRAGQRFANGTPVTAADYAYSFNRSLNPCVASPVAYYLFQLKDAQTFSNENCHNGVFLRSTYPPQQGPLLTTLIGDSIVASDPATLVVTLAQPGAYFLTALTYPVDAALDPTAIGPDPSSERWLDGLTSGQGTSGMFIVHTWDHANGKIVLIPNPHWWGQSAGKRPYLTEIDFSMVRDSDQAYSDFEHGRYDVGFPPVAAQAEAHSRAQFHAVLALTVQALEHLSG